MQPKVIGIGELLWDLLPTGRRMGGAPANFACHSAALGADALVISSVGDDALGRELLDTLRATGIATDAIRSDPLHPTGTVTVEFSADGQPRYRISEDVAWDHLVASDFLRDACAAADAVCFGSLCQRHPVSRAAICDLLAATRESAWRVFDVNLRQHHYSAEVLADSLELANACKLSDAELPELARCLDLRGGIDPMLEQLRDRYSLRLVVYTRGAAGSVLLTPDERVEHPGTPVQVVDTIGAGDSFTAAVVTGLLHGLSLAHVSRAANDVSAHVCAHHGAVPPLPAHLRNLLSPLSSTSP